MIPPQFKLALIFAKMAKDHGPKLLHVNNPDLLTRDLGDAMKQQKDILSDARKGMMMTAYDVLPIILEVKILTTLVAKKLGVDTKGKADINILEEIIAKSEERNGGTYSKDIKDTLEWTRKLFANPEIQDVLKMEMTEIESIKGIKDVTRFFKQLAGRSVDELSRVTEFLKRAKNVAQAEPKVEEKKPEPPKAEGGPQLLSLVQRLQENTKGRDFIIADVHGCYAQLEKALVAVDFDPSCDRLFAIGDLIDRGPQSPECLHYLSQPWFFALRGNHEDMIEFMVTDNGDVDETIFKGKGVPYFLEWVKDQTPEKRLELKDAFAKLPYAIEIEGKDKKIGLVHADVPEGMDWNTFIDKVEANDIKTIRIAAWSHRRLMNDDATGVNGVDRVFFGHSPVEGPRKLGNCFFTDTGGVFRIMNESEQDFYISVIEIAASDDEILNPQRTNDALVRVVKKSPTPNPPAKKLKPPTR